MHKLDYRSLPRSIDPAPRLLLLEDLPVYPPFVGYSGSTFKPVSSQLESWSDGRQTIMHRQEDGAWLRQYAVSPASDLRLN